MITFLILRIMRVISVKFASHLFSPDKIITNPSQWIGASIKLCSLSFAVLFPAVCFQSRNYYKADKLIKSVEITEVGCMF